jgi:hypothetical protein
MDKAYTDAVVDAALAAIEQMIVDAEREELTAHIRVNALRAAKSGAQAAAAHESARLKVDR